MVLLMIDVKQEISLIFGFQIDKVVIHAVEEIGSRFVVHFQVNRIRYTADLYSVGDRVTSGVLFIDR